MATLVFMPWVTVAQPFAVGEFELHPVLVDPDDDEDDPPSEAESTWLKADKDGRRLLGAYKSGPDRPIYSATLVKDAKLSLTPDLSEEALDQFFTLSEAVGFTGLCQRRFFQQHTEYLNRDSFQLIAQRFKPDGWGVAVVSRRRDGSTTNLIPDPYYLVPKPSHVPILRRFALDTSLANAVLAEMAADTEFDRAIRLFNEANTDRSTVSQSQELISTVSALQRFLGVRGGDAKTTKTAFLKALEPVPLTKVPSGKVAAAARLAKGKESLREVWIEDLYALRGNVGHGHAASQHPSIWSAQEHLLLAAHLFPLLVQARLASRGRYPISDSSRDELQAFDWLLAAENLLLADEEIDGIATSFQWDRYHREGVDEARLQRVIRRVESNQNGS